MKLSHGVYFLKCASFFPQFGQSFILLMKIQWKGHPKSYLHLMPFHATHLLIWWKKYDIQEDMCLKGTNFIIIFISIFIIFKRRKGFGKNQSRFYTPCKKCHWLVTFPHKLLDSFFRHRMFLLFHYYLFIYSWVIKKYNQWKHIKFAIRNKNKI